MWRIVLNSCWIVRVQNALARVVAPTVKWKDHIWPTFRNLHWLPQFAFSNASVIKLHALLLKPCIKTSLPIFLKLLAPYHRSHILRSADKKFLTLPKIDSFCWAAIILLCCHHNLELSSSVSSHCTFFAYFRSTCETHFVYLRSLFYLIFFNNYSLKNFVTLLK